MAKWRLINGIWVDVNFTGVRLINGVWVVGEPDAVASDNDIMMLLACDF